MHNLLILISLITLSSCLDEKSANLIPVDMAKKTSVDKNQLTQFRVDGILEEEDITIHLPEDKQNLTLRVMAISKEVPQYEDPMKNHFWAHSYIINTITGVKREGNHLSGTMQSGDCVVLLYKHINFVSHIMSPHELTHNDITLNIDKSNINFNNTDEFMEFSISNVQDKPTFILKNNTIQNASKFKKTLVKCEQHQNTIGKPEAPYLSKKSFTRFYYEVF